MAVDADTDENIANKNIENSISDIKFICLLGQHILITFVHILTSLWVWRHRSDAENL